MIYNEDAYYTGYYRNVREIGAIPALVFDTICGLLRDNESGVIANSTLCDLLGITEQGLRKIITKLIDEDYIIKSSAIGRGNKTVYMLTEKGKQSCPFMREKRETRFLKKGNDVSLKGKQSFSLNKELNKELKEREETPTPKKEVMENFNLFCELYPVDPEWAHEKEACERVWWAMDREWKEKIIEQLKNNQRWRLRDHDNPYWYLKDYAGQDAQVNLPFVKNGSAQISRWIKDGKPVCVMMYQEGDWSGCIYCLESDRGIMEKAGAKYLRNM